MTGSSSGLEEAEEPNVCNEDCHERTGGSHKGPCALDYGDENGKLSRKYSQIPELGGMPKTQHFETTSEKNITCIHSSVPGLKEIDEPQYQEKLADDLEAKPKVTEDLTTEKTKKDVGLDPMQTPSESPLHWSLEFERKQREIIELWDACNVSLVHRTYVFLFFKGDPADSVYMDVELRRLSFLKKMFSQEKLGKPAMEDGHLTHFTAHGSSIKALWGERELLSKQIQRSYSVEERNNLYEKWGIDLDSKQRKLEFARLLWTDTRDMGHIRESAAMVAKLIGFLDQGQAFKEMFRLSFTP